ncbi:MAG: NADH-quinone oxidoreductase subunit L [Planctomycetes bacterium]|nr:NADH-quinone oxidoreductase subunit L [Planctomycetota bacterium]
MLPVVPALPFAAALLVALVGPKYLQGRSHALSVAAAAGSFLISAVLFVELLGQNAESRVIHLTLWRWIASGGFETHVGFLFDPLSAVMCLVVTGVGFLIHVYSIGYMKDDPSYFRFFSYLSLFLGSMLVLVLADNFLLLFVGWEGVGLCSYLLIGFWYEKSSASAAGLKAFLVNRIGDAGFLLGLAGLAAVFGTLDFGAIHKAVDTNASVTPWFAGTSMTVRDCFASPLGLGITVGTAITLALFFGATGKSAQVPLYVWLPDAMEGPTPVSALIHAATMVTAGVYLLARAHFLFALTPVTLAVVLGVGTLTAVIAASIAVVQRDIKRVLAYSTVSQLGFMFAAAGTGAFTAAIFHLVTHAFFKALLFLGAGSVMHALDNETDLFRMGGLSKKLRVTSLTFLVGAAALVGLPPFAGFFSKDEILFRVISTTNPSAPWLPQACYAVLLVTSALTAFYTARMVFLAFYGTSRVDSHVAAHVHESPPMMTLPLAALALLAFVGGALGVSGVLGVRLHAPDFVGRFLEPVLGATSQHADSEGAELVSMAAVVGIALVAIALAYFLYVRHLDAPAKIADAFSGAYRALSRKLYVDEVYDWIVVRPVGWLSRLGSGVDRYLVDGIVNATGVVAHGFSWLLGRLQNGDLQLYGLVIGIGIAVILFSVLVR